MRHQLRNRYVPAVRPLMRSALAVASLILGFALAEGAGAAAAERGVLGVAVGTPSAPAQGALVARVVTDSAAARAGVQPHDLIIEVDSQPVAAASDLTTYVGSRHAGDRITLTVMRFDGVKPERVRLVATLDGTSAQATAAVMNAAPSTPAQSRPSPHPAASAQGLAHVSWTTFTDPYENAFKIDVPQGWKVSGGTLRKVSLLANLVLRVLSPDQRTLIAFGDADSAPFSAPIAARDYVRRFTERTISGACSNLKIVNVSDLRDVEQLARSKSGPYDQWSAAQAEFTCNGERQTGMGGESIAVLQYTTTLRSGHAQILAAFVTSAGQEQAADQLVNHMVASLQQNPAWEAHQEQTGADLAKVAMARWQAEQRQFQQMDDAITNTAHFVAPDGQRYDLDATFRYQWRTPDGHTVGTNTPTAPSPGSTQLQPVHQ